MSGDGSVRDASTVVVLREADEGLEVFMVRRHGESSFMANRYVYPGGTVDPEDCTDEAAAVVEGLEPDQAADRLGGELAPHRAMGLFLAGLRETFEEAGLLLARRRGCGAFVDLVSDEEVADRFERARDVLHEGDLAVSEFAEREDLVLAAERLHFFAHWITPEREPQRYDTRFFVTVAPRRQEPVHDDKETTESGWFRPEAIMEENRAGRIQLAPPTLRTLQQLAGFESAAEVVEAARRATPEPITPRTRSEDGEIVLVLPGDPEFPEDRSPADDGVTRLRMRDNGIWIPD